MTNYGIELYSDSKVKFLENEDLLPQIVHIQFVESNETGSIELPELKGRKAIVYFEFAASTSKAEKKPHKVWKNGITVHWEHSASTTIGYVLVLAYT